MTWGGVAETERIGSTRLERWSGAGGTTLRVRTTPHSSIGWVVVGAYTSRAELRAVVSVENRDITIAALTYYHDPDEIVIALDDPTVNVRWFGVSGSNDYSAAATLAVASGASTLRFPAGSYVLSNVAIGATDINIEGDPLGTTILCTHATNFALTYIGLTEKRRRISNIRFLGVAETGRGVYINGYGYLSFENCTFEYLEYGVYSNSSEWNTSDNCRFFRNKYAYIATTSTSDILSNAPENAQHSATQHFIQSEFWYNQLGFHCDNKDHTGIDSSGSNWFEQCTFIDNDLALSSVQDSTYQADSKIYPGTVIDSCWFELNDTAGTQTFNGFTLNNGDLHFSWGDVSIYNGWFHSQMSFLNGTRVNGYNVKFAGGFSIVTSGDTSINFDSVIGDDLGGADLSNVRAKTFEPLKADRGVVSQVPHRAAFTFAPRAKNVLSDSYTATCAVGAVPPTIAGTPTITFEYGDGFYGGKYIQVDGALNDATAWVATITQNKWYVTTFAAKAAAACSLTMIGGDKLFVPTASIPLTTEWKTFACIGKSSAATGNGLIYFYLTGTHTIHFSCVQVIEFDTLQQAMNFLDSGVYVLKTTEIKQQQLQASTAPAAGTWVVGDIVWNSEPASAESIGWVCTVAGTPGTWKAFGTIA